MSKNAKETKPKETNKVNEAKTLEYIKYEPIPSMRPIPRSSNFIYKDLRLEN